MSYQNDIKEGIKSFPEFPAATQRILELINEPTVDYEALEKAMRYDPGLTANILRLANSAQFGVKRHVDSLHRAFVLLGQKRIFELVMANISASTFSGELPGYQLYKQDFLRHSMWVGIAAEQFANTLKLRTRETLFTAGLLHDIGKLILDPFLAKERATLEAVAEKELEQSFEQKEKFERDLEENLSATSFKTDEFYLYNSKFEEGERVHKVLERYG